MIIDKSAASYLRDTFVVDRPIYLNQLVQSTIITKENYNISGHSAGIELKSILKPAIGEFIERHSLYYNYKRVDDVVPAFRLVDGKTIQVPAEEVFFVRGGKFNDSCGVASHLNSTKVIEAAFLEFFERQSFIFNWLTCSKGQQLTSKHITEKKNTILYKTLKSFYDDVYIFEISLHPDVYVVLGLGIGKFLKGIGLSASFDLQEAINSTFKEMLQSVTNNYNKQEIRAYEKEDISDELDLYKKEFTHLSPQQFLEKFVYLFKENPSEFEIQNIKTKNRCLNTVVKTIEQDLNIEVYCCLIPTFYNNYRSKIVKVFSEGGYPHMDPSQYDEQTTTITFNQHVNEFPNAYKRTPFP